MKQYKQVDNRVELCIFPWMESEMKKMFAAEMVNALRHEMEDGRIYLAFHLSEEKASMLHRLSNWMQGIRENSDN